MAMHDQVNRLHYDIEVMTRRLELEKRRLVRLEKELAVARRTQRNKVATLAAIRNPKRMSMQEASRPTTRNLRREEMPHEMDACVGDDVGGDHFMTKELTQSLQLRAPSVEVTGPDAKTPARVLLNRLDYKRKTLNMVKCDGNNLYEQVNEIRRARLQCNRIFDRLRAEIRARSTQLADFVEETAASQAVYGDVKQRIAVMKDQREGERSSFKNEVMRLREQLKFHDREKKEVEVKLKRAEEGVQRKRGLIVPPEEEAFSEPAIMRRIMKTAFLNCIQRRHIKNHQKSIEVFEQAFSTIKQSTGIEHIEEIVKIFVNLESRNYSLLTYVNHMNREIEQLESGRRERRKLEDAQKQATDDKQRLRQHALQDVDRHLQFAEVAIARDREASAQNNQVLNSLQPYLQQVVTRIEEETMKLRAPSGGAHHVATDTHLQRPRTELRIETLPEWLEWVELALGKFRDLLPATDRESAFPFTAASQVKTLQPKRLGGHAPPPPLVKPQELPLAMTVANEEGQNAAAPRIGMHSNPKAKPEMLDDESEEEDFAERPLDLEELIDRAKRARLRLKKRNVRAIPSSPGTALEKSSDSIMSKFTGERERAISGHFASCLDSATPRSLGRGSDASPRVKGNGAFAQADAAAGGPAPRIAGGVTYTVHDEADKEVAAAAAGGESARDAAATARPSGRDSAFGSRRASIESTGTFVGKWTDKREVTEAELNMYFLRRYKMARQELQVMADRMGIHLSQLCNLKGEFDLFDEDKSGYIDVRELRSLLHKLGEDNLSEEDLEEALRDLDGDGSGEIEFFEFVEWFTANKS